MSRWKKGCLVVALLALVGAFVAAHSQFGKMIAGSTLVPRVEAALERHLGATVAVGGIDYRLWLAELTVIGIEAESADGSWRFSLPEARLRFSPLGNVRVVASEPTILLRRETVGVAARPANLSRLDVRRGVVRALTPDGIEPRASDIEVELSSGQGVARGTLSENGEAFQREIRWDESGIHLD